VVGVVFLAAVIGHILIEEPERRSAFVARCGADSISYERALPEEARQKGEVHDETTRQR